MTETGTSALSDSIAIAKTKLDSETNKNGLAAVLIALTLFAVAGFGWGGLQSLPIAWSKGEYSHGYLIPLIALYLFFRRLETVEIPAKIEKRWVGLALGTLSLALILLGNLTQIPDLATYGLIGFIFSLLVVGLGFGRALVLWVPVAYLIFMLPLPNFVYLRLSIALQLISSEIGVWFIQLFQIPVYLEGNVIDLGVYQLQVAEACSGLRYLFPLASFCFLFAAVYKGPNWQKLVIFLSAVPITVLMNSLRIGTVGVLVDRFGIEQAEGFLHLFEGWVIFASCIALIFLEVYLLQKLSPNPLRIADSLDIGPVSIGRQFQALLTAKSNKYLVILTAATLATTSFWMLYPEKQFARVQRDSFAQFPLELGTWDGTTENLTQEIETVLGADDYFLAEYGNQENGDTVGVFMAFYYKLTGGSGIHSPEVCLPVGGWEVSNWTDKLVAADVTSNMPAIHVNRAIIQRGLSRQLVYYWFDQHGRTITSSYASKMYTIMDSVKFGRTDAGIVRLVTPIAENESEKVADARLRAFMGVIRPVLPDFIPN